MSISSMVEEHSGAVAELWWSLTGIAVGNVDHQQQG